MWWVPILCVLSIILCDISMYDEVALSNNSTSSYLLYGVVPCTNLRQSMPIVLRNFWTWQKKKNQSTRCVHYMHMVSNHLRIVELFYLSIFKISFNFQGKIKSIVWVRDFSWDRIGTWHMMWWFFFIVAPNKWRILQQSFKTQKKTFWGKKTLLLNYLSSIHTIYIIFRSL